jgi:hypothetical protein
MSEGGAYEGFYEVFGRWSRAPPPTSGSSTILTLRVEESGHTEVAVLGAELSELRLPEGQGVTYRSWTRR